MENEKLGKRKAYDLSRREFYRIRQAEEIEKRVALEEAKHVGAYFGKTRMEVGHILEDREFESWKVWAAKETEKAEQRRASEIQSFNVEEDGADLEADIEATNDVADK